MSNRKSNSNRRMEVRREVVEALWQFLFPYQDRPIWEKLVLIMSVPDPWKAYGIPRDQRVPNRWELAMSINRKEIAIFSDRVFEPLVPAISTVDSAHGHIREASEPVAAGNPVVEIKIGREKNNTLQICHIDTDIWRLIKLKTHTIVKSKKRSPIRVPAHAQAKKRSSS